MMIARGVAGGFAVGLLDYVVTQVGQAGGADPLLPDWAQIVGRIVSNGVLGPVCVALAYFCVSLLKEIKALQAARFTDAQATQEKAFELERKAIIAIEAAAREKDERQQMLEKIFKLLDELAASRRPK